MNGKSYVGSAINLNKRLNQHYQGRASNILLQQAILKYGLLNFSVEILEYCPLNLLIEREQFYLDLFKLKYNLNPTASSSLGTKHSEKTRQKMSELRKGQFIGEKNHMFGKSLSSETREKISKVKGITIYLYSLDLKLIECFTSSQKAEKYFESNNSSILKYARSGTV